MEIGTAVGPAPDVLERVATGYDFAELAVGEGGSSLRQLDVRAIGESMPEGVDLSVRLPFRQPLATGVEGLDIAVREYLTQC